MKSVISLKGLYWIQKLWKGLLQTKAVCVGGENGKRVVYGISDMVTRFKAKLMQDRDIDVQLAHVFEPSLDDAKTDASFINTLHADVISLVMFDNMKSNPASATA